LILIPQMGILSGAKALAEPRQYKIIFPFQACSRNGGFKCIEED
jgi:hypothetical protein